MKLRESRFHLWLLILLRLIPLVAGALLNEQYSASFQVPTIQLNKTASVAYQVNLTVAGPKLLQSTPPILSISLCQSEDKLVDQNNSWHILKLLDDICISTPSSSGTTCKNNPYKGRGSLFVNLTRDEAFNSTGDDSLNNFFFCFSQSKTADSTVCDYSSSLFDISPAIPGSKPVDLDTLTSMPAYFPTPTPLALTITSTKSAVLQTQAVIPSSAPDTPEVVKKPKTKKKLSTAAIISIAFGILSLFLVTGLIGLFIVRRSVAQKRTRASQSLKTGPSSDPKSNVEKKIENAPLSPDWGFLQTRSTINEGLPTEDLNASKAQGIPAPARDSLVSQMTINSKGPTLEGGSYYGRLSRNKTGFSRHSGGSVSISPIPSLQSQSPYSDYRNCNEHQTNICTGMSSTAPFLVEQGMSAEEMARLEDEERRLDAAIAAAEAEKLKYYR